MRSIVAWGLALVCTGTLSAPGSLIYRCGPDGRVFSQVPCAGGEIVESSDPRSAAQRAAAKRVAAQEREHAAALERQRRADEAAAKPAAGMNARPASDDEAASDGAERGRTKSTKPARNQDFVAEVPGSRKRRR